MTILTDTMRTAEFIVRLANGTRSVDEVTVDAASGALVAGNVLGKITATGDYVAYDESAVTGAEDVSGILFEGIGAVEDLRTVVNDAAEVELSALTFTGTEATVIAGLLALGIKAR